MSAASSVLALDQSGLPYQWLKLEEAVFYYAKNLVAWDMGEPIKLFRGGISAKTGKQSIIEPKSIIAIKNCNRGTFLQSTVPVLCNDTLYERDKYLCAYCGNIFKYKDLSRDHVIPTSKGGLDVWGNVVTACKCCNNKKDNKLLTDTNMQLLYLPYRPNRFEYFILQNRHILADQMEFLLPNVGRKSRLII